MARVEGLAGLYAAIQHVADQMAAGGAAAVAEAADAVAGDVRARIAEHTGRVENAVEVHSTHGGHGVEVGVFDPTVDYEQYPEFGTSKQAAQPAFQPAAEAERARLAGRVERHVAARLR